MQPPRITWLLRTLALCLGFAAAASHAQQISVLGNNTAIAPGDNTPSLADHTDFGKVDHSAGVSDRTFTIRNTGTSTLQIGPPQRIGGAAGEFTIIQPPSQFIAGSSQTTFTVRFNPAFIGNRATTVRILNNSSATPNFEFAIRGEGTTPQPEIVVLGNGNEISNGDPFPRSEDHTDFGPADIDGESVTRTFTIRNDGDANLHITNLELFGGDTTDFFFSQAVSSTVFAGFQSTFKITFDPSRTGSHTITVRIEHDDLANDPFQFTIKGTGTSAAAQLSLHGGSLLIEAGDDTPSPDDLTKFPSTSLNGPAVTHLFELRNTGNLPLLITSIGTVGDAAAEFTVLDPVPGPISPGAKANIRVRFKPTVFGLRDTTFRIFSNDPETPVYDVVLRGAGGEFALARIEPDGFDAILHITTNPDTTASDYIYSIRYGTSLDSLNTISSFSSPGGTTEQFRHVGGYSGPQGFWQIIEVTIP